MRYNWSGPWGGGGTGTLFGSMGLANSNQLKEQVEAVQHHRSFSESNRDLQESYRGSVSSARDPPNQCHTGFLWLHYAVDQPSCPHWRLTQLIDWHEKLQSLQTCRFSTTFLPKEKVDVLFTRAQRRAKALGCSLLLTSPSHITQFEVSHFFNGYHLNLIFHMLMAPHNSIIRLYELHPFPLSFANNTFLIPAVRNGVLAVSNTNIRFSSQLPTLELQSCNRINKIYLCERNGVMNKFPEDTCLGALYHQKFDLAKRICHFHVEPDKEFIYQLLNNWFLIYVTAPSIVPVTCQDKNHYVWHLKTGITRQHLPAGCTADLPQNLLLSDISIRSRERTPWPRLHIESSRHFTPIDQQPMTPQCSIRSTLAVTVQMKNTHLPSMEFQCWILVYTIQRWCNI